MLFFDGCLDDAPCRRFPRRRIRRVRPPGREEATRGCVSVVGPRPEWEARHEARILAEQARVQAELVHHPEECPHRNARRQRMADRRALALYLARQGGQAPRRWLRMELGWDSLRLEAAVKFPAWFAREGTALRLKPEGWNAVPKETPS